MGRCFVVSVAVVLSGFNEIIESRNVFGTEFIAALLPQMTIVPAQMLEYLVCGDK